MEVLSPTPPVECLSTESSPKRLRSTVSPDFAIQSVRATVSASVMPRKYIAMHKAEA